jgi:hypothetical protein
MNQPQRPRDNKRRRPGKKTHTNRQADLWRPSPTLPDVEPIAVPHEVGALLRSLGDPPMNNGAAAGHYFSTVIERAAAVAVALAVSADVLASADRDRD